MGRILLKDERMVDAVRLRSAGADFDIVRKACLVVSALLAIRDR